MFLEPATTFDISNSLKKEKILQTCKLFIDALLEFLISTVRKKELFICLELLFAWSKPPSGDLIKYHGGLNGDNRCSGR